MTINSKIKANSATARKESKEALDLVIKAMPEIEKLKKKAERFDCIIVRLRWLGGIIAFLAFSYDFLAMIFGWQYQPWWGRNQIIAICTGAGLFFLGRIK